MFPTYSEIVKVVFSQIVSDYLYESVDTSTELKVHGRLSAILEIMFPDAVDAITVQLTPGAAFAIVPFKIDNHILTISCKMDFQKQTVVVEAI